MSSTASFLPYPLVLLSFPGDARASPIPAAARSFLPRRLAGGEAHGVAGCGGATRSAQVEQRRHARAGPGSAELRVRRRLAAHAVASEPSASSAEKK